ncbi:hypothetical protein PITCH_A840064 [uncultured Desulfobacterium sp.]|uniref:Uncharacterized protein n=1 Tax=uncultured Desulfobacterium sp. TaxID=201089 RepID=A0A445N399_9BACT|nr:hypothetical protein PITCH_A840064 [uncultured Desulfobacterium sp.]
MSLFDALPQFQVYYIIGKVNKKVDRKANSLCLTQAGEVMPGCVSSIKAL